MRLGAKLTVAAGVATLAVAPAAFAALSFEPHAEYPAVDGAFSVAPLKINGDDDNDLVVAGFANLVRLYGTGTGSFLGPDPIAPSVEPGAGLVARDFNRDGRKDLAVVDDSSDPSKVAILLLRANGEFRAPQRYKAGAGPFELASGDFDGDHQMDVATSNFEGSKSTVLFGHGDGTFARRVVRLGGAAQELASGDLDRDGRDDLGFVRRSGDVVVRYGNADRTFDKRSPPLDAGSDPYAIAIGNIDGRGRSDLAVTNVPLGDDSVSLMWGRPAGFSPPMTLPVGGDLNPQSITLADFNQDGELDIATANTADSVSAFENLGGRSFADALVLDAGDEPQDIEAAKFDGDNFPDLVTANDVGGNVSALIG